MVGDKHIKICTKELTDDNKNKNDDSICRCKNDPLIKGQRKNKLPHFLCNECNTTYVLVSMNASNFIYKHYIKTASAAKAHKVNAKAKLREILHDELYVCVIMEMRADKGLLRTNRIGLPSSLIANMNDTIQLVSDDDNKETSFNLPSSSLHSNDRQAYKSNIIQKGYEKAPNAEFCISDDNDDLAESLHCMLKYISIIICI